MKILNRSVRAPDLASGLLAASLLFALPARAEVVSASATNIEIKHVITVPVSPAEAYAVLITPARWWSSAHTFSNSAANLTLDAHAGGCFCENLAGGGSVQHMTVVSAQPGKLLRMRGALGPFQGKPVEGVLDFVLTPAGTGTTITLDNLMGGAMPGGFEAMAKPVDGMMAETIAGLKKALTPAGK